MDLFTACVLLRVPKSQVTNKLDENWIGTQSTLPGTPTQILTA